MFENHHQWTAAQADTYKVLFANVDPLAILLHAQLLLLADGLHLGRIVVVACLCEVRETEAGTYDGSQKWKPEEEQRSASYLRRQPGQHRVGLAQRF